jgi:prepilin-type N-terminal cleavage/methylation domain-containing protein
MTPPKGARSGRGFTLIELLVVMAIILILFSILVPVVKKVMAEGKLAKAKGEVVQIANSVNAFFHKYRQLPFPPLGGEPGVLDDSNGMHRHGSPDFNASRFALDVYRLLQGKAFPEMNPDQVNFLQVEKDLQAPLRDPWGRFYHLAFDSDYDGDVECTPGGNINGQYCAVWSSGPDGVKSNNDDIVSFR